MCAQCPLTDTAAEVAVTDSPEPVADPAGSPEDDDASPTRTAATESFWEEVRIDPVKVALPGDKVGYTLRAYRSASELAPPEPAEDEEEDDPFTARERARAAEEESLAAAAEAEALTGMVTEPAAGRGDTPESVDEPEPAEFADEDDESESEPPDDEEAPVFLSHRRKLLLFADPESLVSFVTSDAPHELTQLDSWSTLVKRIRAGDIVPAEQDSYDLDLVVENLRGGHDAWDLSLLIKAGEVARDVAWALRLRSVITAMAPGSPLDELDEALRAAEAGGLGGMLARRRLRRFGAQQASLGWRTVIGRISAAVDWRD